MFRKTGKFFFIVVIHFFLFINLSKANCPLPHSVIYKCHEFGNNTVCTWGPRAGWYEGSGDSNPNLHEGDHAASFVSATWFPYPKLTDQMGATSCLYLDPVGTVITLFQQTGYGEVPIPTGPNWFKDDSRFEGGLSCTTGSASCQFAFGERG